MITPASVYGSSSIVTNGNGLLEKVNKKADGLRIIISYLYMKFSSQLMELYTGLMLIAEAQATDWTTL